MIPFLNRLTLGLVLLSQLVLGFGRGMVLCVEPDGSMQLEIASTGCCEPTPLHDRPAGQEDQEEREESCSEEISECGDCSDQALEVLEVPKNKHALPPLIAAVQVSTRLYVPSDRIGHTLRAPRPPEPRLTWLKSVVLRC